MNFLRRPKQAGCTEPRDSVSVASRTSVARGSVSRDWLPLCTFSHSQADAGVISPIKSVETNGRPASPLDAGREFERASCAPLFRSAAVTHLVRHGFCSFWIGLSTAWLCPGISP